MVSSLFQPERSTLESQVAQLQAQIAAISEAEQTSETALVILQSAVEKVSVLPTSAIATLKAAVISLFNSGDGDGSGGQPITPAPQPFLGGDSGLDDSAASWTEPPYCLLEDCPAESLQGQSVELACSLEDCPAESLQGQSVKIACLLEGTEFNYSVLSNSSTASLPAPVKEPTYVDLIKVTDSVAYMRRIDGEIISVYAGGNNKGKLKNWGDWLTRTHSVTHAYEIREGKRLGTKWELKLTSMTLAQIERLAACDFSKDPRSNHPDAPKRPVEHVPSMVEIEGIGIGDTVRSITVKHWQYKVTKIDSDNFLVCDRLNTNPVITQVLHPGSVELVSKADVVDVAAQELAEYLEQQAQSIAPVIDPTDVPRGVILRQTTDDFIVEFNVFAWVIVRNQGVPEPQQRQIGRLVEGLGKIESYRPRAGIYHAFTRTFDAVNYLISGSGYSQANIDAGVELFESRQQRVLVGVGASAQQAEEVEF